MDIFPTILEELDSVLRSPDQFDRFRQIVDHEFDIYTNDFEIEGVPYVTLMELAVCRRAWKCADYLISLYLCRPMPSGWKDLLSQVLNDMDDYVYQTTHLWNDYEWYSDEELHEKIRSEPEWRVALALARLSTQDVLDDLLQEKSVRKNPIFLHCLIIAGANAANAGTPGPVFFEHDDAANAQDIHPQSVYILLQNGADPNYEDEETFALHILIARCNMESKRIQACITILLVFGARVDPNEDFPTFYDFLSEVNGNKVARFHRIQARVDRCYMRRVAHYFDRKKQERLTAFRMGGHRRLGADSSVRLLDEELVNIICDAVHVDEKEEDLRELGVIPN
jgi:hypothetical protein